jgi:hypothetical protein
MHCSSLDGDITCDHLSSLSAIENELYLSFNHDA